jgi:hypothetical protein
MVTLATKFSAPVKYGFTNAGRTSVFNLRHIHTHIPKTKESIYEEAKKVFEANRFMKTPVPDWTERFIVVNDESDQMLDNFSEKVRPRQIDNPPLSFEEYKKEHLKSFEEYREKLKKVYDCADEIIQKTYEGYCKGSYKSYLIEREQINPGIIL